MREVLPLTNAQDGSSWFSLMDNLWRLDTVMCFFYQTYYFFLLLFLGTALHISYPYQSQQPFQQSLELTSLRQKGTWWCPMRRRQWSCRKWKRALKKPPSRLVRWKTWIKYYFFKSLFTKLRQEINGLVVRSVYPGIWWVRVYFHYIFWASWNDINTKNAIFIMELKLPSGS